MTSSDVPLGMRLKKQAGWNQTEADWRRFLALEPGGCFVAEVDGTPVGTVTTCEFGSVAWIAMVLVDKASRGVGVGTRLVEFALEHLDGRGMASARLDATALGRPIYQKLGFVAEYDLARMEGAAPSVRRPAAARPMLDRQLAAVCDLDRRLTGTHRRRLIERLYRERPGAVWAVAEGGGVAGYAASRAGSRATQIGPDAADDPEAGRAVLDAAIGPCAGRPVFLDVPLDNAPAVRWAESGGLTVQRNFTRMCRGQPVRDRPDLIWASSGPEKG